MGNVLSDEKREQVVALGRMGWTLRRIEKATGVRRETTSRYLRAAGVAVRPPGGWGHAKAAKDPITDSGREISKAAKETIADSEAGISNAAKQMITDPASWPPPSRAPRASACEPYRELIEEALSRGRVAKAIWQDLVTEHGFTAKYSSVGRFVQKLRGTHAREPHAVIVTAPGEEAQVDYGEGPMVRDPASGNTAARASSFSRSRAAANRCGF